MALCILVQHAVCDDTNRIVAGRMGRGLSDAGKLRASELGQRFAGSGITHVFSSPQRRALETAAPIARRAGLHVELSYALDELDFGAWTGRRLADLKDELLWMCWNEARSLVRPPGGENMVELQARVVRQLETYAAAHPRGTAVMVTHAEPIRAAALACMCLPVDDWSKIEISPGAMITIGIGPAGQMVLSRKAAA